MTLFYSKTVSGFFDSNFHRGPLPSDAVAISREAHQALLEGQAAGMVIRAGDEGAPYLAERPRPSPEDQLQADREAMKPSRLQLRLAMIELGVLAQAEAAVSQADQVTQEAWAAAQYFRRLSPLVLAMISALGWTEEYTDNLCRLALTKEA